MHSKEADLVKSYIGEEGARLCREQGISIEVDIRTEGASKGQQGTLIQWM